MSTPGPQLTIVVSKLPGGDLTLTTWGVRVGRYGSLGRVTVPATELPELATVEDLAPLILTALYGLDYDL